MNRIKYQGSKYNSNPNNTTPPGWLIVLGIVLSLAFLRRQSYLLGKVVCCNPSDESTCAKVPICEMDN